MAASLQNLARRAEIIRAARAFFEEEEFLEVETPLLTSQPLPEANIEALEAEGGFLITSPEVFMKPLLARGAKKIFQITKCFRKDERGRAHREEFTMLEWYRVGGTCEDLKNDLRAIILRVAKKLGKSEVSWREKNCNLEAPWQMLTVSEAFSLLAAHEIPEDDFQFDEEMGRLLEPKLGINFPAFLSEYPAKYCPMAAPCENNPNFSERFELYICGLEIANGCRELANFSKQKANLLEEQRRRQELQRRPYPNPTDFLEGMKNFPPAAGVAMGIDRLTMLLLGEDSIDNVLAY